MIPPTVRLAAAFALTTHDTPTNVIVTTEPDVAPVAVQLVNPEPNVIAGVAGRPAANAGSNVTVIVLPATRLPRLLVVNPTVHGATNPVTCGDPANVTVFTAAAEITTAEPGDAVAVSRLVFTENVPGP